MKNSQLSTKKSSIRSDHFYKALEQKSQKMRPSQTSIHESRAKQTRKITKAQDHNKIVTKSSKHKRVRDLIFIPSWWENTAVAQITQGYSFEKVITKADELADLIHNTIQTQKPKFVSISVTPVLPSSDSLKISVIGAFIEPLIKQFQRATICIYSIGANTERGHFYDMLSIRRQVKTDSKFLVQTNICNNSKSSIILRKLLDVAKERERVMGQEKQTAVSTVVVKIKGIVIWDKNKENGNVNDNNSNNGGSRDVEVEVCAGGQGELGSKDLMGAQQFRQCFQLIQVSEQQEYGQVSELLTNWKNKAKSPKQSQLIQKIRNLQDELNERKKQLELQKQRVAEQEAIEAELEDIVLPSERPMVSIAKYQTRFSVGPSKKVIIQRPQ